MSRLPSKPVYSEKFLGEEQMRTAEYLGVFEKALTTKLPSEIEFRKKSNSILKKFYAYKE